MGVRAAPRIVTRTAPSYATILIIKMENQYSPVVFCEWLKRRRKALDMSQGELANRAGCSVSALRKIEQGERRPSKQLAELLAKALEIPEEYQSTFIRVARGELNLGRLDQLSVPNHSLPTITNLVQMSPAEATEAFPIQSKQTQHIPLQSTPFIGRESELAALGRLFSEPQCRLLTLTGIGGVGKTRLAIEFALSKQAAFPGGVYYIPLNSVNSSEKIISAIADVLDFRFSGPHDPKEQIFNFIASQIQAESLFVFDNLEHLLGQTTVLTVEGLFTEMLQRLPNVKILGTSRERLNLHNEWAYELHGLSFPPIEFIGKAEEYDSIALFLKSAQRVRADFQASADERLSIMQISQLVEGVPLAIELAAAWADVLTCQEIAFEIISNMDFLTTSMHDIPERHRSIRATFNHSWGLLSEEERWALCQLSVFRGGFTRDAAQVIAGATLTLLASLSAKSLVHRLENGRYDLHEVIRQYALAYLDENPQKFEVYNRYSEYYLAQVQESGNLLKSGRQQEIIRQLANEIDNIRSAWVWAIENNKFKLLRRAGRGFGWYFEITGLYREGIDQLEMLVQALNKGPSDDLLNNLLGLTFLHQGLLFLRKGEFESARKLYEQSVHLLRPGDDQILLADALVFLGTILHLQGEYEAAAEMLEEGLLYAHQNNEKWYEAWAVFNLGYIDSIAGRSMQGYDRMLAGLAMWRALGDPQSIALALNFLAPTLNKLGHYEEAKSFMYESIALCEQSKNRWGKGTAYRYLGLTCLAEGQFAEAQAHLLKSLEIFGDFAVGWDIARSLTYLGDVSMKIGNFPEANRYYLDAIQLSLESQGIPILMDAFLGISDLKAQAGDWAKALVLCYYILDHHSSDNETKTRAQQLRVTLEAKLDSEQIEIARLEAAEQSLDKAVNLVLNQY